MDIRIRWRAFPLHPETPKEGRTLEELFAGRQVNIPEMLQQFKVIAQKEGLPFGDRRKTYNSRLAQELAKWAEKRGQGEAFHLAAFRAYFAEGKNIADPPILVALAEDVSLDRHKARRVIEDRLYREAVDADWALAARLGITAVPTFITGAGRLVGAQPFTVLKKFVKQGGHPQ